ncbi:MAG: helix-turn-helix domain-containing protein [Bdellovibrio sp.]
MSLELIKIQNAIKHLMKTKRFSYVDLGSRIGASQATIKRRLNGEDISIEQLQELALALDSNFYELIEISKEQGNQTYEFSQKQEGLLAKDTKNMMVFRQLLMKKTFKEVATTLALTDGALRKILRLLEEVELIKLMPMDRIVLLANFPFKWLPNGPLEKTYEKLILETILRQIKQGAKNGTDRKFELALSDDLHRSFCADLEKVYQKYKNLSQAHMTSLTNDKDISSGILFVDRFSCWG